MNLSPPSPLALYETLHAQGTEHAVASHLSCPFTGRRYLPEVLGASEADYIAWAKEQGASQDGARERWRELLVQVQQTSA
jgi:hypothetical protein